MTDPQKKLDNFKIFVKSISRNQDVISEYEDLSLFKVQALAYVLLIPQRNNLPNVVKEMQKKLDFDDEYSDKFRRYLEYFVEYITGVPVQDDVSNLSYEERLELAMQSENCISDCSGN